MKKLAIAVIVLMWALVINLGTFLATHVSDDEKWAVVNLICAFSFASLFITLFIYDKVWRQTGLK